MYKVRNRVNT